MTKRRKNASRKSTSSQGTDVGGFGAILTGILIVGFAGAVVINYYFWNWIGSMLGWQEIGFWWFIPITGLWLPIKIIIDALFFDLLSGKNSNEEKN